MELFTGPRAGERIKSVGELTRELKGTLEGRFASVAVRGEISNLRPASSGHVYFTLKDAQASLAAVLFKTEAARLRFRLADGQAVIARGRISLYEPRGQYQLICDGLEPEGAGALAVAFEQLKERLAREGLFAPERKRRVPFLPRHIGVVTSPTGAALQDFLRVLQDRFPIPVLVAPAKVQGEGAAEEIAAAIARLASREELDVIVVTRGGGSVEDLWAFNEERVARAIAASHLPVVSAIGHEVDFTIADFVADLRCATPTDAAKRLAPVREELLRSLEQRRRHLGEIALGRIMRRREQLKIRGGALTDPRRALDKRRFALDERLDRLAMASNGALMRRSRDLEARRIRLERAHPAIRLKELSRAIAALERRLTQSERQRLQNERLRLTRCASALDSLSPLKVLGRGYSIAFKGEHLLTSGEGLAPGDELRLLLPDLGEVDAEVRSIRPPRRLV